jgi:hypothetical protein
MGPNLILCYTHADLSRALGHPITHRYGSGSPTSALVMSLTVPTVGGSGEGVLEGEKDAKITGERDRSSCEEGVSEVVGVN